MIYHIKTDLLPGYGYSLPVLYRDAFNPAQLRQIIAQMKDNSAAYRISVNDRVEYESKGSGTKKRWFKK